MKRKLVIAAVASAVLIGGGTAAAFADGAEAKATSAEPASDRPASDRPASDRPASAHSASAQPASADEVIAAALKHTPGTAVGADREDDGADAGRWHVDVVKGDGTEYTVTVAPDTGKVVGVHRDKDDDGDDRADGREDLAALKGTDVDAREAAKTVAAKGTVTDVDLDDEGRATVWSVDTARGGEWTVDAHTGKVTQDLDD